MLAKDAVTVVSYADSKWKLGADRGYRFEGATFVAAHDFLKGKLGHRLVAALSADVKDAGWRVAAKHLRGSFGSQGVLAFGPDWIAFETADKERSRTWRFADIENVSSAGPYELTITTLERSRIHFNGYRDFSFQLKEALEPSRYQQLWLRFNNASQPNVLNLYKKER
jgi:hypothetical protein